MSSSTILKSRSQTNSFAYKNIQAYTPFYLVEKGNSFYGLSIPQYSHTIYHSLAEMGGSPGSNGRIGRDQRTNNLPSTPFIPPNIPYLSNLINSIFYLQDQGILAPESGPQNIPITSNNLKHWSPTRKGDGLVQADAYNDKSNTIELKSGETVNNYASISQSLTGTIYPGNKVVIEVYASALTKSDKYGLGVKISDGTILQKKIITNISPSIDSNFTKYTDTFTITNKMTNPVIEFFINNNDTTFINILFNNPTITLIRN